MSANRNRAPLAPVNRCSPIPSPARNSPYPCKNASNSKGRDREWLPVKTDFVIRCTFEDETTRVMSPVQKARSKQAKRNMFKTEFCRSYYDGSECPYGERCQFAHSKEELREIVRHPRYKTEPCVQFLTLGYCQFGHRCLFLHSTGVEEKSSLGGKRGRRLPVFEELTSSSGSEGHGLESEHERAYDHDEELEHFVPSSPCPSSPCPDFGFGAPSPCFEFYAGHAARPDHFQL